jgi:hypothetical protein
MLRLIYIVLPHGYIFGVDKATFAELDLPRFAEGFLAQSSDAQKGRNFFQVWEGVRSSEVGGNFQFLPFIFFILTTSLSSVIEYVKLFVLFRIGMANMLGQLGYSFNETMAIGKWSISAFELCIRSSTWIFLY